jgi:4-amino-4-deoxy-L-arabinose transferase-like glycosyltransferase
MSDRPAVAFPPPPPACDCALLLHVLAATLLAAALRAFHLGAQSLWIDELFTWMSADIGRPLAAGMLLENIHGPLYGLIVHVCGGLFGDSEWALRLPSLVGGVAVVPALAWLAVRWLGRDEAVWAAWLAAGSPFLVWYSQEARSYMLLILWVCVAGALLLGPVRRPFARAAAYGLAAGAGLLTGFSFALLAPLHLRWWLAEAGIAGPQARGAWRRLGGAAAVALALLVLLSPWAGRVWSTWDWQRLHPAHRAASTEAPLRHSTTFHAAAVPFALHAQAVGYTLGPPLRELRGGQATVALARHLPELGAVTLVFGVLGVAGLVGLGRRRRLLDLLLAIGVPLLVVSLFALRNFKVFHPRYVAVAAPFLLLVVAQGLVSLRRPARIAAALGVAALWAVSLGHHYFDPAYAKEDYRGALGLVAARAQPGEKLLAVGADEPVYYYYRGALPVDRLWPGYAGRPGRLEEELEGRLAGARGTWIVLGRPEDLDAEGAFVRTLGTRHPEAEEFRFGGVRVWHVKP